MGYETMSMVLETYVAANDNRAKPLASVMQSKTFQKGLTGEYKMNKKHFPTVSSSFNVITRNGSSFMTKLDISNYFKRSGRLSFVRSKAFSSLTRRSSYDHQT